MSRLVVNFSIPLAGVETFRFAFGEGKKNHNPSQYYDTKKALHFIEICTTQESMPKRTVYHAAATDGHRLLHFSWDKQKGDQDVGLPIYLDSRSIKALLSSMPGADRRTAGYRLVLRDGEICLDAEGEKKTWSVPVCTAQELEEARQEYPANWMEKIIHGEKAKIGEYKTHDFTVDGKYLTSFVRYLEDMCDYRKKDEPGFRAEEVRGIRFRYNQPPGDPMILTDTGLITSGHVEYILMPMYTPEET